MSKSRKISPTRQSYNLPKPHFFTPLHTRTSQFALNLLPNQSPRLYKYTLRMSRKSRQMPRKANGKFLPHTVYEDLCTPSKHRKYICLYCHVQIRDRHKTRRFTNIPGKYVDWQGTPIDLKYLQRDTTHYFHPRCASNSRTNFSRPSKKYLNQVLQNVDATTATVCSQEAEVALLLCCMNEADL